MRKFLSLTMVFAASIVCFTQQSPAADFSQAKSTQSCLIDMHGPFFLVPKDNEGDVHESEYGIVISLNDSRVGNLFPEVLPFFNSSDIYRYLSQALNRNGFTAKSNLNTAMRNFEFSVNLNTDGTLRYIKLAFGTQRGVVAELILENYDQNEIDTFIGSYVSQSGCK